MYTKISEKAIKVFLRIMSSHDWFQFYSYFFCVTILVINIPLSLPEPIFQWVNSGALGSIHFGMELVWNNFKRVYTMKYGGGYLLH